jgi:AcrR family transcriptional regulator
VSNTTSSTETAGRTRAKRTSPALRRAQIMDAAVDVFGRVGYRRGSLKDVAGEVGLTIQGLLHYFPTKEELLMAVLEHRNQARENVVQEVSDRSGVVGVCRYILEENQAHPGFMRLFVTLSAEATDPDHPAHEHFVERYRRLHDAWTENVRSDIAAGRIRPDADPGALADEFIALCDGLQLQALFRPDLDIMKAFEHAAAPYLP